MTNKEKNDLFYVCSLIEYISRETRNRRGDIVKKIGQEGIEKLLHDAEMNHCLSFEEVSDEVITHFQIQSGEFEPEKGSPYTIPDVQDIGKLYAIMIEDLACPGKEIEELMKVFLLLSVMLSPIFAQICIIRIRIIWNAATEKVVCWNEG